MIRPAVNARRPRASVIDTHADKTNLVRRSSASATQPRRRSQGLIRLGALAPQLQQLRARMSTRELCSDDLPAAYVRLLYALPEDAPVISRVDQLATENRAPRTPS